MAKTIQSVDRAVAILEALAAEPRGLALTALARALGVPPQTAQSLVRTLEAHGLVTQAGRGTPYLAGQGLLRLARMSMQSRSPGEMAREAVVGLSRRISEYVLLAELRGRGVAALVEVSPQTGLVVRSELRGEDRIHTMATGRLLLALADDATRNAILARLPAKVDRKFLERQLRLARKHNCTVLLHEAGPGVAALAVPVRAGERVVAALGVALPLVRFTATRQRHLLRALRTAASDIGQLWQDATLAGH